MSLTGNKRSELDDDKGSKDASKHESPAKKRKLNSSESDTKTNDNSLPKVVIVGSGLVGRSWAVLFGRGGYQVTLYDIDKNQLASALQDIQTKKLPLLAKFNLLNNNRNNNNNNNSNDNSVSDISNNMKTSTNLSEALTDAVFIQMAVPEILELKQKVLQQIDQTLVKIKNKSCIISSSSSTIVPSKLIGLMSNKENISRFLVSHPVNPPMAIPLVEIVPSPQTDIVICSKVKQIMLDIGMKPIVMKKECDGFVLNRLQYGLLQIAYQMYEEGIANAEDIDLVVSHGLGTRWSFMGPFETIHLNAPNGVNDYCQRYASSCIEPIVSMQNNSLKWKPETWTKIHNEMSQGIPVNELKQRCEWRDNRLMELARLKNEQCGRDGTGNGVESPDKNKSESGSETKTKRKE